MEELINAGKLKSSSNNEVIIKESRVNMLSVSHNPIKLIVLMIGTLQEVKNNIVIFGKFGQDRIQKITGKKN